MSESATNPEVDFKKVHLGSTIDLQIEQHGDNEEIAAILAKTQLSEGKTSEKKEDNETPLKSPFKRRSTIDTHPKGTNATEVFCMEYAPDSRFLASGCGDGSVRIFNSIGRLSYTLNIGKSTALPTTCIRFRPAGLSGNKGVVVVANADGSVSHYHMSSQKLLYRIEEPDNQVYTIGFRQDGERFVTAGRDCKLRIYEDATKTLLTELSTGQTKKTTGHSNRVYAAKYNPEDENIILSGGWDNTIQIWDARIGQSVRSIYGPHICGDALDIKNNVILSGSWSPKDALQLWDFGSGKLIQNIKWNRSDENTAPQMLYAASFSPDGNFIAAGGSGDNEGKVFDYNNNCELVDTVFMGDKGIYSLAFSQNGRRLAFAGGANDIQVLESA